MIPEVAVEHYSWVEGHIVLVEESEPELSQWTVNIVGQEELGLMDSAGVDPVRCSYARLPEGVHTGDLQDLEKAEELDFVVELATGLVEKEAMGQSD